MTLSEAIIHCEEIAERCAVTDGDLKCEMQHRQLAEWLRELQQRRAQSEWNPCKIGWILCNDKMPEIGRDVLISKKPFNILGFEQRVVIGKRQYDPRSGKPEWWSGYGVLEDKVVIAWMPLPEAYKEGETDGIMLQISDDGKATLYESTYDITIHCESEKEQHEVMKRLNSMNWIPILDGDGQMPEVDDEGYSDYILLSFRNASFPCIGQYREDEEGGAFYDEDDENPLTKIGLFVNAWMPLPERYHDPL